MRLREENEDILRSVVAKELTPLEPHRGYEVLRSRYLDNGHINRIIRSYATVVTQLSQHASICVLGASPLEGFLLRRLAPQCTVALFGSPEHLAYNSAGAYEFSRSAPDGGYETVITSHRHNIESPLPVDAQRYDCVVCFETLEHLRQDPLALVVEIRRVLKADGVLFLSTPNLNSARSIQRALSWESPMFFPCFGPPPSGIIHAHEYSLSELLALLQRGGFDIAALETFNHESSPPFNHDRAYRSKGLLPTDVISGLGLEDVRIPELEDALASHHLRGDYIFVSAVPERDAITSPFSPLYQFFV